MIGPLKIQSNYSRSKQGQLEETAQVHIWLVFSMSIVSLGNLYPCQIILTAKKTPQIKTNRQAD